jgi:hypothetical protein
MFSCYPTPSQEDSMRGEYGPSHDITDEDRKAPREGTPVTVLVYVTYRLAGDPKWYRAVTQGKRWPTGAGTFSRDEDWVEAKALSWATKTIYASSPWGTIKRNLDGETIP